MPPPSAAAAGAARVHLPAVWPLLTAPPRWQCVDFISDLHLQCADMATFAAWLDYLQSTPADAVFILGDLFEVWIGDDVRDSQPAGFEARCQQVLAHAACRLSLYFMHGNRDFLLGDDFARESGMTLLSDPTTLAFDQQRWLLSHGDALCLDDVAYQQFRVMVRSSGWQASFLAKPLAQRQLIAAELRQQSELIKAAGDPLVDIDQAAACAWLEASGASTLIHGHTHDPITETLSPPGQGSLRRLVLGDWCARTNPPRLPVLRLQIGQPPQRINLAAF